MVLCSMRIDLNLSVIENLTLFLQEVAQFSRIIIENNFSCSIFIPLHEKENV